MLKSISQISLLILALFQGVAFSSAPPLMEWQRCYGGSAMDISGSITHTRDGNILILGNVESHNGDITSFIGSTDIWLTKTDSAGNILWRKSIGGTSIDVGVSVIELSGGDIAIGGYSASTDGVFLNNKGNFDVILICTDSNGTSRWVKNFGGSQVDLCYSMILTTDGNLVLAGASFSDDHDVTFNDGGQDMWFIKVDLTGNLIWDLSTGGTGTDICYSLAQDASGCIYGAGTTNSNDGDVTSLHGNYDVCLVKISNNGNLIWNKTFGGTQYETAQTLLIDNQQRILVGGYTRSDDHDITHNQGFGDIWFIQVNSQGSLLFQKTFGGTGAENLYSVIQTNDGGYVLAGGTTSNDFDIKNFCGYEDVWLLKLNNQFSIEWSRNYGGSGSDRPVKIINKQNGGYLLASYSFSNDNDVLGQHGSADIWIVGFGCKMPVAGFFPSSTNCLGDTLIIQNTSVNSAAFSWSINNVFYSSQNSVKIPLVATGNYNVLLTASTCSASDTTAIDLNIINCSLPAVNIMSSSKQVCVNGQVTFSDNSNATGWQWTFPGGTPATSTLQTPVVTYSQPGVYSVMLTASNVYGNQSAMRLNYITVHALPAAPVITINGNQLTSSFAANYQWLFNNQLILNANSQQFNANNIGYYSVVVQNSNGCSNVSQPVMYSITGINSAEGHGNFAAYPNPTSGHLEIVMPSNSTGLISVYDMKGVRLLESKVENASGLITNLTGYPPGMYRIVFTDNNYKNNQISIIKY